MSFSKNVFVNCPFDEAFYSLLRPILFTIYYLALTPRIALERFDSGEARLAKIVEFIKDSKYSIHDISRLKAQEAGEYYRLNMPFELGLDMGCRLYKGNKYKGKKCLVLESERFRYQAALSDLSGSDIQVHGNEPEEALSIVRNWLNHEAKLEAPGPARIWGAFNDFMADNYDQLTARGFSARDIRHLPVNEMMRYMQQWVKSSLNR